MMLIYLKTMLLELLQFGVCLVGDYNLYKPVVNHRIAVAACDSLTHGVVGALSWAIVCDIKGRLDLVQCLICMFLAMSVDMDHFLAAKSLDLKAALSLQNRPPFHSTSVILIIDIPLLALGAIWRSRTLLLFAMIFTVAWASHHLRDAVRRGMWFYPLGSTPPLSKTIYIGSILVLPLVFRLLYINTSLRIQETVISVDPLDKV